VAQVVDAPASFLHAAPASNQNKHIIEIMENCSVYQHANPQIVVFLPKFCLIIAGGKDRGFAENHSHVI